MILISQHIRPLITILLVTFILKMNAQIYENDASLWVNVYLEKSIGDKFSVHLNQKNRINNNFSQYGMGYADLGLTYKINKHFKVQGDYVFAIQNNYAGQSSTRQQFYAALIARQKLNRWTFLYRNMVQLRFTNYTTSENGKTPKLYERNKLTVKYEINKRITGYASEELRIPFDQTKHKRFNRSRSILGLEYGFSRKTTVDVYFAYQRELNAFSRTNRDFIYGIGFSHEF